MVDVALTSITTTTIIISTFNIDNDNQDQQDEQEEWVAAMWLCEALSLSHTHLTHTLYNLT